MRLRIWRGVFAALLLLSLVFTACGDDDVAPPPPGVDGGETDLGPRDAGADASEPDATACPDDDGDGHGAMPCADDCDDGDATRYPGATEVCDLDDEDCNDTTYGPDADGDGVASSACCNGPGNCGPDCDDMLNTVNPGAAENCNGLDDDCDGSTDEGVCVDECALGAPCGAGLGTCIDTFTGYTCVCIAGYSGPAVGGPCVDIDECSLGTADCDAAPSAVCANTPGDFTCTCPAGFVGSGHGTSGCDPRFTDLGGGLIQDNNGSGLVWQQGSAPGFQNQAAAIAYCAGLTLAGGGWRLPTKDELVSLVDARFSPLIDPAFFPEPVTIGFWSSSPVPGSPTSGWLVHFVTGMAGTGPITGSADARCVRP